MNAKPVLIWDVHVQALIDQRMSIYILCIENKH